MKLYNKFRLLECGDERFQFTELEVSSDRAGLQALLNVLDEPDPTSTSSRCSTPAENLK